MIFLRALMVCGFGFLVAHRILVQRCEGGEREGEWGEGEGGRERGERGGSMMCGCMIFLRALMDCGFGFLVAHKILVHR
jgi:hypothetical protein